LGLPWSRSGRQQWPNFAGEEFVLIFVVKQIGSDRTEALNIVSLAHQNPVDSSMPVIVGNFGRHPE
jgi:hypothetical protein